jgi:hypothetical protein
MRANTTATTDPRCRGRTLFVFQLEVQQHIGQVRAHVNRLIAERTVEHGKRRVQFLCAGATIDPQRRARPR